MHNIDLILTLTCGLATALAFGYVTHRLGLSPIVGYLLAGIAVGPHSPGFVADPKLAKELAEVGVILLMFGVGLHFHLEDLLAVRRVAIPGAIAQSFLAATLGTLAWVVFGGDWGAGVVFGLALSVASTVVLTRVLADNNDLHTPSGHVAVGWLVVEDLFTVLVLVVLPTLFGPSAVGGWAAAGALGLAALKVAILVALTFLVGGRAIPWLLERIAAARSRELFTLAVLVLALGIAVGSSLLFGVSMALGAFLAGMTVGRSEFSVRAATDALPMRDAFAVLFFVSVGMLFDPRHLLDHPGIVAATLAVILIGKPLAALGIVVLLRYPPRVAIAVAVALAQIGEFSFILAGVAVELGIFDATATNALVAAAIISITLNPLLYRAIGPMERWAMRRKRLWKFLSQRVRAGAPGPHPAEGGDDVAHRAIVVGYGPVGRTVSRLLRANGIEPTIVEMNLETVRRLRAEGVHAVYGDAGRGDTLKEAGIARAANLILSSNGMANAAEVVRIAKELNPGVRVLRRLGYVRDMPALLAAGAEAVFSGEGEVALAVSEALLRQLGATSDQVDRERDRVRADFLAVPPAEAVKRADEPPKEGAPSPAGN